MTNNIKEEIKEQPEKKKPELKIKTKSSCGCGCVPHQEDKIGKSF